MSDKLSALAAAAGFSTSSPLPDVSISQVTDDSRQVVPGALFVAVKGARADGHQFIPQAVAAGASAVLLEEDRILPKEVIKIVVPSTREWLGPLVHAFLGSPSRQLRMAGVTGTNGKTTTVWLIRHLLEGAGISCGLLGTVRYQIGEQELLSENTTPGAVRLQGFLSSMVKGGLSACAMEVSSHALDQRRTDGIKFDCAVFTNLTPEHLDYHPSVDRYLAAKLRLFEGLSPEATALINRDDPAFEKVRRSTKARVVAYGFEQPADLTLTDVHLSLHATRARLVTPEGSWPISWRLIGRHNLENLLAACGAARALGVSFHQIVGAVADFSGVPGRLEQVAPPEHLFPVYVDYAHTDGALRRVLSALRSVTARKILLVFGCGGDRDRTKRPRMGQVAAGLADRVIVTSDNPRSEDPGTIAREVAAGFRDADVPWETILDRREAIQRALESADEKWLILIAGKGHETGQIVGRHVIPFDDRAVVREFLGQGERVCR